ncbi:MAG TPA: ATP-binding cassette domain-containing protein, partial [Rectinemataceae bacterium]|nr:ATP-binding cassette domain-containing protein [Rectinemataceae bacterium]
MSRIELQGINKYYGDVHVLKDLDLVVEDGDFMTLLGPSGCGKTTTLRVIAGLEAPRRGILTIDGTK